MVEEGLEMEHRSKLKMFSERFTFIKLFQIAHSMKMLIHFTHLKLIMDMQVLISIYHSLFNKYFLLILPDHLQNVLY